MFQLWRVKPACPEGSHVVGEDLPSSAGAVRRSCTLGQAGLGDRGQVEGHRSSDPPGAICRPPKWAQELGQLSGDGRFDFPDAFKGFSC